MKPLVDIFIPLNPNRHIKQLSAAIQSALTQSYWPIQVIVYIDGQIKDKCNYSIYLPEHDDIFYVQDEYGPHGNAYFARKWYFDEFEDKAPFVKFLDADDILTPNAIEIMMGYMLDDVDAVFCPLLMLTSSRYYQIIPGLPKPGHAGSGSMLLRKEFIEKCRNDGWEWPNINDHDNVYLKFLEEKIEEKKYNIKTTNETGLYIYMK